MKNKKLLAILIALSVAVIMTVTAITVFALSEEEKEEIVTEKVEELFANIVDSVNASSNKHGYKASYDNNELEFSVSIDGSKGLIDVITLDKLYDVVEATLPVVFVTDKLTLDDHLVYDGSIKWNGVKSFIYENMMGLEEFSKLSSKTLLNFTMKLEVYGVDVEVPVSLKLDITDSQFAKLKSYAHKASKYVLIYKENDTYYVRVDATDVYDLLLEEYILEEGYTVKQAREKLNRTTPRDLIERLDDIKLSGRLDRFNDEYQTVLEIVDKLVAKIDESKYAAYIDTPVGILDKDNDGTYGDARTVTIPVKRIIEKLEAYAVKYIPDYDGTFDIAKIVGITSVTISYDVEVAVHDSYTATFVDEDGSELYATTILEGETPEYAGKAPEKATDEEYIYTFAGWSDGTNVYVELPELLADTTYTAVYDKEPNVCKHPNATPVDGIEPDCSNPGMTAGVVCPDCGETLSGLEEIPATGNHVDADGEWDFDETTHFHVCQCGEIFNVEDHDGDATCTEAATCSVCGTVHGAIDESNHGNTELRGAYEADCGNDGYTGDTFCLDCGKQIATGDVIPATGKHTGGVADCCNKAVCSVCGKEYGDVDSSNHGDTELRGASEADCGNDGYTGDTFCLDCGEQIATGDVIPATGKHTGGVADCCNKAVCSVCGKEYGDVDSSNHGDTELRGASEADCGNDGYTGDTFCLDCGKQIATGDVIPATGNHTYGDWVTVVEPSKEATGLKEKTCTVCGDKVEEVLPKLPDEPETGDSVVVGSIIAMAAVIGMAAIVIFRKKNFVA